MVKLYKEYISINLNKMNRYYNNIMDKSILLYVETLKINISHDFMQAITRNKKLDIFSTAQKNIVPYICF